YAVIGKSFPRKDALEKATGMMKYVSDLQFPRMLYAKFLRSPHAHARITRIDTSRAEAMLGVKCVLTHLNTPKVHPFGKFEFLLDDTVHAAGEEVAGVAAETPDIAEEALQLIEVEYEVLPAVFDAEEAMKPGAPLVHPQNGNNMYHGSAACRAPRLRPDHWLPANYGDVDKGFQEADFIVEGSYKTSIQHCVSPMPRSVICQWTGNELTCWADSQQPVPQCKDMARCLGIPQSSIRLIAIHSVGGYGAKNPEKIATLCAVMAKRTSRAVKCIYTREEDLVATHRRPNYRTFEKIGVKKDGTITAAQHKIIANFGRDSLQSLNIVSASGAATCNTLYQYQNTKYEGCGIMTNIIEASAMNGYGDPEAGFGVETLMDEAAEKTGIDPVEFRIKNCMRYGTRAVTRRDVLGLSPDELEERPGPLRWGIVGHDLDGFPEGIRKAAERAGWKSKWKGWQTPMEVNGTKRKGIGIGIGMHMGEYRVYSGIVKMNHDGSANVLSSAVEIGQGIKTAMAQVIAEELGIRYEDVNVLLGDTAATPEGWGVVGSGGTSSAITACWHAAKDAKRQMFKIAAQRLGVQPDELESRDRRIYVKAKPDKAISVAEACLFGYQITGEACNPPADSIIDPATGKIIKSYTGTVSIVEVEVDTETGQLEVLRLTAASGCGTPINPILIENQIDMGVVMGNGYGRSEGIIIDQNTGVVLNSNLLDYKLMGMLDMPRMADLQEIIIPNPSAWGAFGAKGFSESGTSAQSPAIANAIYNAVGVRMREIPITPQRILKALGKSGGAR
ncbi:MAG: xanthine dehydrogenase family protein molybdopterin-binding subunit, partial [Chloroflexota bacterium]|nr:xanthine dehydrogenase family protein molybdopterin-binding subunit [Chloroflexota bacterium]